MASIFFQVDYCLLTDTELSSQLFYLVFWRVCIPRDITDYLMAVADKDTAMAQLLQSQKMESIGTLTGGVAHDFNTIMGIILGNTDRGCPGMEPSSF